MQKIIDGMLTAGCEATVASFLALTEKVRVWNKCQVKAKILPEDQLAEKFKDLVIRMGEVAENKLQITINNAVMQTMVRKGDVDAAMPKIIIDSCCIVLGDLEGKQLVSELEGKDSPIDLRLDNKAAGDLAYNPEHHPKTKHIDRRHFYIRECVENHRLRVPFVNSHDNLADFFTKPLNAKNFFRLRDIIMNVQHDLPSKDFHAPTFDGKLCPRLYQQKAAQTYGQA